MQVRSRGSLVKVLFGFAFFVSVIMHGGLGRVPAWSGETTGDKPANNLEIIHEKLKADKKLIVAKYMELTELEGEKFWPVFEEYQKDVEKLNQRLHNLLQSYAADYRNKSFTDEKAQKLLDEAIALEKDEAKHRRSYAPKVLQVLPAKKAARYLQIENEHRILMRYDLAVTVPLVQ